MYEKGCQNAGRPARRSDWRVAKSIFVADDEATAQRYAKGPDSPYRFYFRNLVRKLVGNGKPELFKHDRVDAGQRDHSRLRPRIPSSSAAPSTAWSTSSWRSARSPAISALCVYAGHDWVDARLARRSMELMASEVMPRLNKAIGVSAAAQ